MILDWGMHITRTHITRITHIAHITYITHRQVSAIMKMIVVIDHYQRNPWEYCEQIASLLSHIFGAVAIYSKCLVRLAQ